MTDVTPAELNPRDVRKRRSLVAQTTLRLFGKTGAIIGGLWIGITAILAVWAPLLANSRPLVWRVDDPELGTGLRFPLFELLTPQDALFIAGFVLALFCLASFKAGGKLFWVWLAGMCAVFAGSMVFYLIDQHQELANAITSNRTKFEGEPTQANAVALGKSQWSLGWWWSRWVLIGLGTAGLFTLSQAKLFTQPKLLAVNAVICILALLVLLNPVTRIEPPRIDTPPDHFFRIALEEGRASDALFPLIPYSPNDTLSDQTTINSEQVGVRNILRPPGAHPTVPDIAREMQSEAERYYGIRLYELSDAAGETIAIPQTIEDARQAEVLLWQAYQDKPGYTPARGEVLREQVQTVLDRFEQLEPETRFHIMGTTSSGQDLAARMIHGSRIALYIGFISTGIAVVIGIIIGGLLGYFAGWVDLIGLRLVEIFASIPVIMLLIMIVAFYGRSLILMMVVLGFTGWVGYAYFVRAEFLKLRKMDYVMAARASGTPLYLILFKHMLPNGVAPVLVGASFGIAGAIMTEATLSFLGLGLEPTESSWGQMLDQARQGGSFSWWLAIFPGSAIFLTVFAYNLIGEALRDVIDPRTVK
jgi:ABC-type dipeptide/oligopeptide/nickel transport system permease subunit